MQLKHSTKASNGQASSSLQVALDLAAAGIPVFPVDENKRPLVKWKEGATTDENQIRKWWKKWPDAMPAFPTGEPSGIAVLDIDRKDGKDGVEALRQLGFEPESPFIVRTKSGGQHLWFKYRPDLRCSVGQDKDGLGGVDVRGERGFAVAPGAPGYAYTCGDLDLWVALREYGCLPAWPEGLPMQPRARQASSGAEPSGLSLDALCSALMALSFEEREERFGTDAEWFKVARIIADETGASEEGNDLWHEWSEGWGGYDYHAAESKWNREDDYDGARATVWTILQPAVANGWTHPDFEAWRAADLAEDFDFMLSEDEEADISDLVGIPGESAFFAPASTWASLPVPRRKWHVEDLIPGNTVTILGGDGGTGKSLLALQLAVATATGTSWIGRDIDQPGKAMVLSAEDDVEELQRRVAAICEAEGLPRSSLGKMLVRSTAGEETLLATLDGKSNTLKATSIYKTICTSVKREKPSLLVLDTLADLHAGNENDRAHARQFIGLLRHLAIEYQCAVVLLAHPSLTGMNSGSGLSGSTAWNASVRSRLYLKRVQDDGYESDPNTRTLETMKANYGPTGGVIGLTYLRGAFVPDAAMRPDRNAKAERVFLSLLTEFNAQGRRVSPNNSSTFAPKVFANHPKCEGVTKKAFATAMETLLGSGNIRVSEEGPPSKTRKYLEGNPQ